MTCINCSDYSECYINKCICFCHRTKPSISQEAVAKVINEMLAEGLNGQRYNFLIDGEELKKRLGI